MFSHLTNKLIKKQNSHFLELYIFDRTKGFKKLQKRPDPDLYFPVTALEIVYFSVPDPDSLHFRIFFDPDLYFHVSALNKVYFSAPDPFLEYGSRLQIIMDNLHKKNQSKSQKYQIVFSSFFLNKLLFLKRI